MNSRHALLPIVFAIIFAAAAPAAAQDMELGSRKFKHLALAVGAVPPDCRGFVNDGAVLSYVHDYLHAAMGQHFIFANTDNAPVLMVSFDCMRLTDDTDRGDGRTVGYAVNLDVRFYRPFREDIAYIYAATWHKSSLMFIPYREFSQDYFDELLDESLDEFTGLWLADHPMPLE